MRFSFIIPTRGRTVALTRLCDSIRQHTSHPEELEIILVVDSDDEPSLSFHYPGLNIRKVELAPGKTMGELNMAGYRASSGQFIMLLNDDIVIRTPDWDNRVRQVFSDYPDGVVLVHLNENIFQEKLCTFPFLTRTFCELSGGICPEGYIRYRIDDHVHNVFDLLALLGRRRRVYLPDVLFEHFNVTENENGHPEYIPNPEIHAIDTGLFDALLPERKRLALSLLNLIESPARNESRRVRESLLERVTDSVAIRDPRHARKNPPDTRPRVTIAVVSANLYSDHARRCIELIKEHTSDYDLVIVDNNRGPGFNHSREMNRLLDFCNTDYLVLMDDDVFVEAGWLEGMMRAMEPDTGVVTPVHKDVTGNLSYAGVVMQPDHSGHHTHVMTIGDKPQCIQTLCSAIMLVDMTRCGHVRLDESYSKYFLDIDYGLRIWEEGLRVVCTPWSHVTHIGGGTLVQGSNQSVDLFETQRRHFVRRWVDTRRIHALRRGVWQEAPEVSAILQAESRIESSIQEWTGLSADVVFERASMLLRELEPWPALKNYIAARANTVLGERPARCEDREFGHWAVLLGVFGRPVLYQAGLNGMNIVLWRTWFYALPNNEGTFDYQRMCNGGYSRSFEAGSPRSIRELIVSHPSGALNGHVSSNAPGVAVPPPAVLPVESAGINRRLPGKLQRIWKTLPYLGVLRPSFDTLFDAEYYSSMYPDVARSGIPPFVHFMLAGAFEGRNPHPLFDTSYYVRRYPDVAAASVNPLGHYLKYGAAEGRQPHPLFDPEFYLACNPDVRRQGINPLVHYVRYGAVEGRSPNPASREIANWTAAKHPKGLRRPSATSGISQASKP